MQKIIELYKKYEEIVNYLIFGVLTTVVSLATKYLLLFTILDAKNSIQLQIAVIVSWITACTFAYVTNRIWVFKSKSKNILKEAISFYGSRIATLLLEMGIMFVFVTILHFNDKIIKLVAQVVITILNYVLSKLLIFKKK